MEDRYRREVDSCEIPLVLATVKATEGKLRAVDILFLHNYKPAMGRVWRGALLIAQPCWKNHH